MNRHMSLTIAGIGSVLLVSGCSSSSASHVNATKQTSTNTRLNSSQNWKADDKSFLIQGKIIEIHNEAPHSLKIDFERVIQEGGVVPSPKSPDPVGTTFNVRFKRPFIKSGLMHPKVGAQVILVVTQYTAGSNDRPFWGSARSNYYYQKNGKFYGEGGIELGIPT